MIPRRYLRYVPAVGTAVAVCVTVAVVYWLKGLLEGPAPKVVPRVQQVTVILPPPQKIEEPPPPEPEIKQEVEIPQEAPEPLEAPASADLGIDADGTGSGDGFGLQGKKGGRDLLDGGPYGWYAGLLRSDIRTVLAEDKRVRHGQYTLVISLWLARDGTIQRVELASSTGNAKVDEAVKVAVARMEKVREPPPDEMPQPVRLKITSKL